MAIFYVCVTKYDGVGETILFHIQPILTRFSASAVNVVNGTRMYIDVSTSLYNLILINCITDAVHDNETTVYILDAVHVDVTFMGRVYAGW